MSNITKHEAPAAPGSSMIIRDLNDIVRMGKIFAESGMFSDAKDVAKAIVKIQAGAELGISPFQAMSGIHIISGKPTLGAGVMASMLDSHAEYDFEVTEHTNEACEIKFFKNKKLRGTSRFTIEDAKKAGTQNLTKFPKNMLYARCMSNGVKWYAPGLFTGPVYVPEEFEQGDTIETTYQEATPPARPEAPSAAAWVKPTAAPVAEQAPAMDAEYYEEPEQEQQAQTTTETGEAMTKSQENILKPLLSSKYLSAEERDRINKNWDSMTKEQAAKTIDTVMAWIKKRKNLAE